MTESIMENVSLSFTSPVTLVERLEGEKDTVKVGGLAVPAQESRNGRTYKIEDLHTAKFGGHAFTEGNMLTMGLNHSNDVTDNVGKWTPIFSEGGIEFKGVVYKTEKHPYIIDMLNKGLLPYVSVEMTADLVKEKDVLYAKNQDVLGLDFVKVPGLPDASVGIAEAFDKAFEKELTTKTRKDLPDSAFVFPGERKYPIHDIAHARNALARVSQHGTPEEKAKVRAAVYRKYPELKSKGDEMTNEKIVEEEEKPQEEEEKPAEEEKKDEPEQEKEPESSGESLIDKVFDKLDKKVDSLESEIKNLKEKPQSKGVVTEKEKPEFNLKFEKRDGKVDFYSEDVLY